MNILVLCAGNASSSLLLEAILNARGQGRVTAYSAGTDPAGSVHPQVFKLLEEQDFDTSDLQSTPLAEFAETGAPEMDLVLSLAPLGAPKLPGQPVRATWAIPDPADQPEDGWEDAFRATYDLLDRRAAALLKYAIETLDPGELKATLDRIGKK